MKRRLLTFALAVLTVGLLGSCSKINERIDGLDKRVYDLENNKIASVEQQITAINTSINELKAADVTINGKIADLKTAADAQQALIDALQEADRALGQKDAALEARIATLESQVNTINGQIETLVNADIAINTRIDQLQSYVDTEIGEAKDWATASFASLTEYRKTAEDLAALSVTVSGISTTLAEVQTSISGLDAKIDGIDVALQEKITTAKTELEGEISDLKTEFEGEIAEAISTSETGLQSWVNEQLSAYYTAAQMDAKIDGLQNQLDALKTDTDANKSKIEELETKLDQLTQALDDAKTTIKTEYEAAIATAINDYNGTITQTIQTKIDEVNATIANLTGRVETLESDVATLKNDVAALKAMIQSVSITPAYSDGSVEAVDGILTLKCIVSPAEALIGMESLKDCLLIYADSVKVKTKATTPAYMTIEVSEASVLDADQGAITLKADITEYLPKGEDKVLTVAVNIKNGISDFTTEFVPVYVAPGPVLPAGALPGVFSVSATKKVHFSKGKLYADGNKALHFEANQYSSASSWDASHVSHFTWSSTVEAAVGNTISGDNLFCDESHKVSVDGGEAIYYALSKDEWTYLFNARTMTNSKARYSNAMSGVTIGGSTYKGVFLYPDNYNGEVVSSSMTWDAINAAGIVFLPAVGSRYGSDVSNVGTYGYYWSSTANDEGNAYCVFFSSDTVLPNATGARGLGYSVRLVTEASAAPAPTPTTTGTAKATIGGSEVDVNWVQLWAGGPKFAEYNVGASSATDAGITMTSIDAIKTGAEYVWGSNWCTPSKDQMDELLKAATVAGSEKVTCVYTQENYVYGFKFTGSTDGYTDNSVFFPAQSGDGGYGQAYYWSSTTEGPKGLSMLLFYSYGDWYSAWYSGVQDSYYLVRPVLRN